MSFKTFYFGKRELGKVIPAFDMLRMAKRANMSDGAASAPALLGAIGRRGGSQSRGWCEPRPMTEDQAFLHLLNARRADLNLDANTSLIDVEDFAAQSHTFEARHLLQVNGSIPVPTMPIALDLEHKSVRNVKVSWGAGTKAYHIRVGYLDRLYHAVNGDHTELVPAGLLRKHLIITSVLVSSNYTVEISSKRNFKADFKAEASEMATQASANITLEFATESTLKLTLSGETPYVLGVDCMPWRRLNRPI